MIRVKIDVMDIGRKSAWCLGAEFLSIGVLLACFSDFK